ncbi:MAG: glycosyltransferase [Acholeplasmatales bacterium]|nr:glycosyltransferase [Acholeplasmatales bacterium]
MRIGLFTDQYFPIISSVVTSVKMLYDGLTDLGHECFIFTNSNVEVTFEKNNVISFSDDAYSVRRIHKAIKKVSSYNLDIIHVHTEYKIAKLAIKAAKKCNIPLVHTLHMNWNDYTNPAMPDAKQIGNKTIKGLKTRFKRQISRKSTVEIVPTKKVLMEAIKNGIHHCNEIRIIPTGIDLSKFYPSNFSKSEISKLKEQIGLTKEDFVFLCVSRFSEDKNINTILEAFSKTVKDNPNIKLLIVGGGSSYDELKKLAKKLKIKDKVIFTGFIEYENLALYYQLGHVFVNAALSESQGISTFEALASGLPLLAQKDEVIEDVLVDYYNGIYFDGVDELHQKMKELLKATSTLKSIRANTLKSIYAYSMEEYSKRILNVYFRANEIYNTKNKK